jgi:hypothetical protein
MRWSPEAHTPSPFLWTQTDKHVLRSSYAFALDQGYWLRLGHRLELGPDSGLPHRLQEI